MKKSSYLTRLSRAARWQLPAEEAAEAIADYRELLFCKGETDAQLVQELGTPWQAVKLAGAPKKYRGWLAAFSLLALFPVVMTIWLFAREHHSPAVACLAVLGALFSLIWFQAGPKPRARQKKLFLFLGAQVFFLLLAAGVFFSLLWLVSHQKAVPLPPGTMGQTVTWGFRSAGLFSALLALWGLAGARMENRAWRSLYVMGLTVLALCLLALFCLHNMNLDTSAPQWWLPYLLQGGVTGLLGALLTGAALC